MYKKINSALSQGIVFQQDIRQQVTPGAAWNWERFLPGPISREDAEMIMAISGCECDDCTKDTIRFYTDQNHPAWSDVRMTFKWRNDYGI